MLYAEGYGNYTWKADSPVPDPDTTLWDIASVTKVVGTTSAAMVLVDRGLLELDSPVTAYLPRFAGGRKDEVTVRMLLNHTSGLRSYRPYFKLASTRTEAIDLLYEEPLQRAPGTQAVYSDINAMLLGLLVEQVAREPLDQFVQREVFQPIQMDHTRYVLPKRRTRSRSADRSVAGPSYRR